MQWFKVPSKIYFERNSIQYLQSCRNVNKVFIVTDGSMVQFGFLNKITEQLSLRREPVQIQLFCDVEPDPDIETVRRGTAIMKSFEPDTIIALGGGSVIQKKIFSDLLHAWKNIFHIPWQRQLWMQQKVCGYSMNTQKLTLMT